MTRSNVLRGLPLAVLVVCAHASPAPAKKLENQGARAALAKAIQAGDLGSIRVAWTVWQDRNMSQTLEIKQGKMVRSGGMKTNNRSERPLTDDEKKQLMAALKEGKVQGLVFLNRDVKNQYDRVLNLDVLKADGSMDEIGAFVRTKTIWDTGATAALSKLLESWLKPDLLR